MSLPAPQDPSPYESGEIIEEKDTRHNHDVHENEDTTANNMHDQLKASTSSSSFNKKRRHHHHYHREDQDVDDRHHHIRHQEPKRHKNQDNDSSHQRNRRHHSHHHLPSAKHHKDNKTSQQQLCKTFDEMDLKKDLLKGIYAYGFERPSAIQQRAILPIVRGHDVVAQSQSGTGKTAVFAIASLQLLEEKSRDVQVLVLSPTRELAEQSQRVMQSLGDFMNVSTRYIIQQTFAYMYR
jgi:hypothetical protein